MKERPIIMSAESVRAIMDGRKTVTRRVVKPQPPAPEAVCALAGDEYGFMACGDLDQNAVHRVVGPVWAVRQLMGDRGNMAPQWRCPFGAPGDRLWVRETWATTGPEEESWANRGRWRPSTHMPRWASRLTLEVLDVRVERVQRISPADCWAEGIQEEDLDRWALHAGGRPEAVRTAFETLWDRLNAKRGYPWDENPWVWRVEFRRIDRCAIGTWCPQCGPNVDADKDGCCRTCGAGCMGPGADEALELLSQRAAAIDLRKG